MAKYIDADRLKEEFQKRFDICKRVSEDDRNALDTQDWYRGKYTAYSECLSFIDSLQQELPEVDLQREIEKYYYDNFAFISSAHTPTKDIVSDIATHFYERGQKDAANKFDEIEYNRQRAEEKMSDKTLDEAAEEYLKQYNESEFGNGGDDWDDDIIITFKAGAKWLAEQGSTKDGVVIEDNSFIKFYDGTYIDLCPNMVTKAFDFRNGDKVIVQIKKKED